MAEIKSTLALIMERTKNLTLTDEEKRALQMKEWEGRVKGWVQKFMDGLTDIHHLKSEFQTGASEYPDLGQHLKTELLKNIQPDRDNSRIFQLFEEVLHIPAAPLKNVITSFENHVEIESMKRMEHLREVLRRRNIHGSSVIPNLNCDDTFQKILQRIKSDFRHQLASIVLP